MTTFPASSDRPPVIRVSAVVLRDQHRQVLTVRKRGTSRFMFPGGKLEPDESPEHAAIRECAEELGLRLLPAALQALGTFEAEAANEAGHLVRATVFEQAGAVPEVRAAAEIEEIRWLNVQALPLPDDLAPLLRDRVLPLL